MLKNFPWDAKFKTNYHRIVKVPVLGAGKNWIVRSVLSQSKGYIRNNFPEGGDLHFRILKFGAGKPGIEKGLLSRSKRLLKNFPGDANL